MEGFWLRFWVLLVFFVGLLALHCLGFFDWITLSYVQGYARAMQAWVDIHPYGAAAGYMGLVFLATTFFVPVTALATVISGFLFGTLAGVFYTLVAVTLGSVAVVLMIRHGLGHAFQQKYGHYTNGFNHELVRFGPYYILMIHIMPMTPTVFVNVLVGLSSMSIVSFAWATALGILPGTIVHVLIGKEFLALTSLKGLFSWQTLGILMLLALLVVVPMIIDRWIMIKRFDREQGL